MFISANNSGKSNDDTSPPAADNSADNGNGTDTDPAGGKCTHFGSKRTDFSPLFLYYDRLG